MYPHLQQRVVVPEGIKVRRWEDGRIIGYTDLGARFQGDFGVPYYVVHRAHLHEALYARAKELGVVVALGSRVARYDERGGSVELEDGSVIRGDLVVAVDGESRETTDSGSFSRSLLMVQKES